MIEQNLVEKSNKNKSLQILSHSIIVFWAMWSSLVAFTDSINFLQAIHRLPRTWVFTSSNYDLVVKSVSIYGLNYLFSITCFLLLVLFAWLIAVFFWRAAFTSKSNFERYLQNCYLAFLLSFAVEAFFILADEVFIQYGFEHGHMDRLGFKLITFLVFFILRKTQ